MSIDKEKFDLNKIHKLKNNILVSIFLLFLLFNSPYAKGFDIKELLPVKHNIFVTGSKMHVYHNGPAVLLDDGNVLVLGGNTKQAEIYDYKKNNFILSILYL